MGGHLPSICIVTSLEFDDSQTILYAQTVLEWGYPLIAICPGQIPESLSSYGVRHYVLPLPTHNFDFHSGFLNVLGGLFQRSRNSLLALFYLLKLKPDIILSTQPDSWLVSIIARLFLHNRVVADLREIYEDRAAAFPVMLRPFLRRTFRLVFRLLSGGTDEIIHVSEARQEHYSYLMKPGVVISPFPRLENYLAHGSFDHRSQVSVVHAGSLRWPYASTQFVESMRIVLEQAPNVKFVVVGGVNPDMAGVQQIESLIREGKLEIMPRVSHEAVIDILRQSDIGITLVLPLDQTHILAMPRKLFEYLAAGLPVVAADVPTLRDILVSRSCGVLVDPRSSQDIADGILKLVFDPGLRKQLGGNGRKSCEMRYNWQLERKKMQDLLTSLPPGRA